MGSSLSRQKWTLIHVQQFHVPLARIQNITMRLQLRVERGRDPGRRRPFSRPRRFRDSLLKGVVNLRNDYQGPVAVNTASAVA